MCGYAIPEKRYPSLNKNNLTVQNSNSNDMKASLAVLFLEKNDNKTNTIEVTENSMFFASKIYSSKPLSK